MCAAPPKSKLGFVVDRAVHFVLLCPLQKKPDSMIGFIGAILVNRDDPRLALKLLMCQFLRL